MKKQFYSHLVTLESVRVELSGTNISESEKKELLELAQKQLHHVMLDTALEHVKGEDKKEFLKHLHHEDHEKAWQVLRMHTKDIEHHLLHAAHELYEVLRDDIRELKKNEE